MPPYLSLGIVCIVACASPQTLSTPPSVSSDDVPPAPVPLRDDTRFVMRSLPHGTTIAMIATTSTGDAAVTVDTTGGARLWPALDGTLEPRAIDLPPAAAHIAIGRDKRGFVIAVVNSAGGLVIQVVEENGRLVERTQVASEPAFRTTVVTANGVLALRADHRLIRLASDGAIRDQLEVAPGRRILALVATGDRVALVVETAEGVRIRHVAHAKHLFWEGSWIDAPGLGAEIAFSPAGDRLAYVVRTEPPHVVVTDTFTEEVILDEVVENVEQVLLPTRDRVAIAVRDGQLSVLRWRETSGPREPRAVPTPKRPVERARAPQLLALAKTAVVRDWSGQLEIVATPSKSRYLGYAHTSPNAALGPDGTMLVSLGGELVMLDSNLAVHSRITTPLLRDEKLIAAHWLSGTHWIFQATSGISQTTALVDIATGKFVPLSSARVLAVRYEPSTNLVTLSGSFDAEDRATIYRYTPGVFALTEVGVVPSFGESTDAIDLYPTAKGLVVIATESQDRKRLAWVKDPAKLALGSGLVVDDLKMDSQAFVGATGRVYLLREVDREWEYRIYRDGVQIGRQRVGRNTVPVFDSTGERVAWVDHDRKQLSLATSGDQRTWLQSYPAVAVKWSRDDALTIVDGGIARLDLATGSIIAARCGWQFGLHATPVPSVGALCGS